MATRRSVSTARRNRKRKNRSDEHIYGAPVPEALHEAIETERDNLSKAESLLACMVVSMEYENDPLTGPYYPAVAQIARELVGRSINGLDPFVLKQRLRNKIEEGFCMSFVDQAYPLLHQGSSRQALIGSRLNG